MKFGIIGSGSWATALAKILTDNRQTLNWQVRTEAMAEHIRLRHHNPNYLSSVYFEPALLNISSNAATTIAQSDCIIIAIPSAYVVEVLDTLPRDAFEGKLVLSAIKGILPGWNLLLNEYLSKEFSVPLAKYFSVMGPCHAEEVAAEKLSYLTFSGLDTMIAADIAKCFNTYYLNTVVNDDIFGVQYAAVLKNIYALGAGIAHGLEYGDNFLSVFIANAADEMGRFLRRCDIRHVEANANNENQSDPGYAASAYLGDLLVTCYSLFSRNRTFGNMIGKGYSVKAAQLEMNMVAEGYNASKCIHLINEEVHANMPIAEAVYDILWRPVSAREAFRKVEKILV
jgi:glycerol-3-phosphate dehydrogenase (NAD(P)+)